ncbi:tetratricopeptide repeat protein [Hirschia maritima]|uniref:tetratricopeptide repeat protein n=1 Tax=Hirschia maritima TaxID=1121961 RepID=UPI00035C1C35|nr:tetratricopeptide repeat protein [Hirschia maritima]
MQKLLTKIAGIFLGFCVLSNCASPGLEYTVSEPAFNTEAAKLREVAVMEFDGFHGHAFTASLDGMLRHAVFEGYPWFTVASAYSSGRNNHAGSVGHAVRVGESLNVTGVWFGDVDSYSSASPPYYETRTKCVEWDGPFDCERRVTYEVECFDIRAEVQVHALLANVVDGYVVADERLSDSDSDRVCRETYYYDTKHKKGKKRHYSRHASHSGFGWGYSHWEFQDRAHRMERRLVARQASKLRRVIAPFERTAKARLMDTPTLPYNELVTGFESAIKAARNGNNMASCRQFEAMVSNFPDEPALNYNLGACAEMFGEIAEASELYQRAEELAGPAASEDFLKVSQSAFRRLNDLQNSQVYLTQQLKEAGEIVEEYETPTEDADIQSKEEELAGGPAG